jgi:hypothetical protein
MYSRKQFFFAVAGKCFDLIKSCNSFLTFQKEDQVKESDEQICESLFLEAISLGIDPGTMGEEQLIMAVNSLRENNNESQSLSK